MTRLAAICIIVNDDTAAEHMNAILHEYSDYIIGRMGLPRCKGNSSVVTLVMDAPENEISALAGKLGKIAGLSVKAMMTKN